MIAGCSVGRFRHAESTAEQKSTQKIADLLVIIDDEKCGALSGNGSARTCAAGAFIPDPVERAFAPRLVLDQGLDVGAILLRDHAEQEFSG